MFHDSLPSLNVLQQTLKLDLGCDASFDQSQILFNARMIIIFV